MNQFIFYLSSGIRANVIRKTEGRKKSPRLFFFRLRRSRTLISYLVAVGAELPDYYTVYRYRSSGVWVKGGKAEQKKLNEMGDTIFEEIKKGIDNYELTTGQKGYLEIATFPVTPDGSVLFVTPERSLAISQKKGG